MHIEHDHFHQNGGNGSALKNDIGPGHNHNQEPKAVAQWQHPHLHDHPKEHQPEPQLEPDLDLVETAFVEGFSVAEDSTSFLRLARIPFEAKTVDGTRMVLLRVETNATTDIGSVMPHMGGGSFRYDPLPARMISRRSRLRFIYFNGRDTHSLKLADVRSLSES